MAVVLLEKDTGKLVTLTVKPDGIQRSDTVTGSAILPHYLRVDIGVMEFCPFSGELLVETAPGKSCHSYSVNVKQGTSDTKATEQWWKLLAESGRGQQ